MKSVIRRNCGLPEGKIPSYGHIKLNNNEKCHFCKLFETQKDKYGRLYNSNREDELYSLIKNVKRIGEYDVIVMYTGGKDSTYTLYKLVMEYNLKVLAITWDNGFFDEDVISNIKRVVTKLNVDHIFIHMEESVLKDIYRNRILNFGRICSCGPLSILFISPYIEKYQPSFIFYSSSFGQLVAQNECVLDENDDLELEARKFKMLMLKSGKVSLNRIASQSYYSVLHDILSGEFCSETIKVLKDNLRSLSSLRKRNNSFYIYPSYYMNWDKQIIISNITKLGWKLPKAVENTVHTSCKMEQVKSYLAYKQGIINFDILEMCAENRYEKKEKNASQELIDMGYCNVMPGQYPELLEWLGLSEDDVNPALGNADQKEYIINTETYQKLGLQESKDELLQQLMYVHKKGILI